MIRLIWAVAGIALLTGCGGGDGEILVSAAASLTDAFAEMESAFEQAHPGRDVVLNLGGSAALAVQVLEGAPVAVFAAADPATMARVASGGHLAGDAVVFARNRLVIAVPAGNPGQVTGVEDFADSGRLIGLCAEPVPCGALARQALAAAGVEASIATEEPDVRALLTKIVAGELDAGMVYATDVDAAGAEVEAIPLGIAVETDYEIAVLAGAPESGGAAEFVAFVQSADGRAILARHGFGLP